MFGTDMNFHGTKTTKGQVRPPETFGRFPRFSSEVLFGGEEKILGWLFVIDIIVKGVLYLS